MPLVPIGSEGQLLGHIKSPMYGHIITLGDKLPFRYDTCSLAIYSGRYIVYPSFKGILPFAHPTRGSPSFSGMNTNNKLGVFAS